MRCYYLNFTCNLGQIYLPVLINNLTNPNHDDNINLSLQRGIEVCQTGGRLNKPIYSQNKQFQLISVQNEQLLNFRTYFYTSSYGYNDKMLNMDI